MSKNSVGVRSGLPVWLLVALLALSLGSAGWVIEHRLAVERANHTVELVLDYPEASRLATAVGKPVRQVVADFKAAGVTTLAVGEYTVTDYLRGGNVVAVAGRELAADEALGRPIPPLFTELRREGRFHARSTYLIPVNAQAEREFGAALARRFGPREIQERRVAGRTIWESPRELEWLLGQNLGLAPDQLRLATRLGLAVAPRWSNYPELTRSRLDKLLDQVPSGAGSVVIFSGKQLLGYPNQLKEVAQALDQRKLRFGYVEFANQDGEEELARLEGYRIIRVHSITPEEMAKIRPEVAAARDRRAVRERTIRAIYLRPFLTPQQVGAEAAALKFNLDYVRELRQGLASEGFTAGRAVPAGRLSASATVLTLLVMGALASGVLLLRRFVLIGAAVETGILVVGTLGALAGVRIGLDLLVRQLFALGAGVSLSTLAVLVGREVLKRRGGPGWLRAFAGFAVGSVLALSGAALVVAFLGENRFMMAIATFSGVKVLHALPLLLVWFALARERLGEEGRPGGWRRLWDNLRRILGKPVTWEQAMLVVLGAGVLLFYLLRTGTYTNVPAPAWERSAREALERLLSIRPRTKEFLLGHPALLLALLLEAGGVAGAALWPLYVAGAIGQLSMVDTFSHIHTPLWVSGVRTVLGLLLGAAAGLAAYGLWRAAARLAGGGRRRVETGGGDA